MKKILNFVVLLLFVVSTGYCSNESFVIKELDLELKKCPAGRFMMGSPEDELGRAEKLDEKLHSVIISKPFYIGKYVVTQKQYQTLMGNNPSLFKGENKPVENVSWNDAKEFINRLSSIFRKFIPIGYKFDLPTEAQWEYACRAGTTTALNNGKNITSKTDSCYNLYGLGWYSNNSGSKTHAVGYKKPNAWGIYDMHGNVWEWCRDWYGNYKSWTRSDPICISGSDRVRRGGSWNCSAIFCRSACRNNGNPNFGNCTLGFRVALVPSD